MVMGSVLAGCLAGERATSGECPEGETCSSATPDGLYFRGTTIAGVLFGGLGPELTAVGGTQVIGIEDEASQPFTLPFEATASGALAISAVSGTEVTVEGILSGETYLRIAEPRTQLLYDRILVGAQPLELLELAPPIPEVVVAGTAVAFAAGDADIAIALYGPADEAGARRRLVDTSMTVDPAAGTVTAWDTVRIEDAAPGIYPINVTAADRTAITLEAEIVAAPTSLAAHPGTPTRLVVEREELVCFSPLANGKHVVGLAYSYSVDVGSVLPFGNCASVKAFAAGPLTLTATAGGVSTTVTFDAGPGSGARSPQRTRWNPVGPGDRAR